MIQKEFFEETLALIHNPDFPVKLRDNQIE